MFLIVAKGKLGSTTVAVPTAHQARERLLWLQDWGLDVTVMDSAGKLKTAEQLAQQIGWETPNLCQVLPFPAARRARTDRG